MVRIYYNSIDISKTQWNKIWKTNFCTYRHFLIMDSLTWDISIRQEEIYNINRYWFSFQFSTNSSSTLLLSLDFVISFLEHLSAGSGIPSKTRQRANHVLKVYKHVIANTDKLFPWSLASMNSHFMLLLLFRCHNKWQEATTVDFTCSCLLTISYRYVWRKMTLSYICRVKPQHFLNVFSM